MRLKRGPRIKNYTPTIVDGIKFHSKKEAQRFKELKLLQQAGIISNLLLQPRYPLVVADIKICTYVGDFLYTDARSNEQICEDVKGYRTDVYKIKIKFARALYRNIQFKEV